MQQSGLTYIYTYTSPYSEDIFHIDWCFYTNYVRKKSRNSTQRKRERVSITAQIFCCIQTDWKPRVEFLHIVSNVLVINLSGIRMHFVFTICRFIYSVYIWHVALKNMLCWQFVRIHYFPSAAVKTHVVDLIMKRISQQSVFTSSQSEAFIIQTLSQYMSTNGPKWEES